MKMVVKACILLSLVAIPLSQAEAVTATGRISRVTVSGGTNYGFRVYLDTGTPGCSFVYLNTSDDNYQARVATLLTAYATSKQITLSYGGSNFCPLYEFDVAG